MWIREDKDFSNLGNGSEGPRNSDATLSKLVDLCPCV